MHFTKAVLIVIPCVFTLAMIHHFMGIAPFFQPVIDAIVIRINERVRDNDLFNERLNGFLLDILQHLNPHFPPALDHA
jgi:hypothetical protein